MGQAAASLPRELPGIASRFARYKEGIASAAAVVASRNIGKYNQSISKTG